MSGTDSEQSPKQFHAVDIAMDSQANQSEAGQRIRLILDELAADRQDQPNRRASWIRDKDGRYTVIEIGGKLGLAVQF